MGYHIEVVLPPSRVLGHLYQALPVLDQNFRLQRQPSPQLSHLLLEDPKCPKGRVSQSDMFLKAIHILIKRIRYMFTYHLDCILQLAQ